jgi:hypothetical protein
MIYYTHKEFGRCVLLEEEEVKEYEQAKQTMQALRCRYGDGWDCDSVTRIEDELRHLKGFLNTKCLNGLYESYKLRL